MASELKTQPTDVPPADFIASVDHAGRREDSTKLCALLQEITGDKPVMWGPSIIGFGRYTYVNTTKKPADWPIIGFSPRKANMTLYIMPGFTERPDLMEGLGKYRTSVSCLYFNRLSDLDEGRLRRLCRWSVEAMRERYPTG